MFIEVYTVDNFAVQLQAYAEAMMIIPKVLAQNSGFDPQEITVKLQVCN